MQRNIRYSKKCVKGEIALKCDFAVTHEEDCWYLGVFVSEFGKQLLCLFVCFLEGVCMYIIFICLNCIKNVFWQPKNMPY